MFPALGSNELRSYLFRRQLLCEFFGTFVLMLVRKTVSMVEDTQWAVTKISFALGLTVAALTKLFGRISGCHINPAVSIAFFVVGEMSTLRLFFYVIMQFLGAISAVCTHSIYAFANSNAGQERSALEDWQKILLELILTTMFIMLFRTMSDALHRSQRSSVSMAIGFAYTACLLSGTTISEVALNPLMHFASGPNIFAADFTPAIGSTLGGIIGALTYEALYMPYRHEPRTSSLFDWLHKTPSDAKKTGR
ncbi:aquaporin [Zeugodacus cucurbitae]|uniref:Aquaporin n=1 Tax=Zeugodacus cucurbitae TaxID=28588 RepID=A0A0A1X8L8_ZEUCU|nr:aquaporin [Zeugodacus cucurbitae]